MERLYPNRLRVMEGVDEMLEAVVSELRAQGELDNTYIFFSSDNGFHMGQHRFNQGKETAYEEDIAVPMIVRGPGVPADATRQHLVLNQDLAPTFADIADASVPNFVDGRSFLAVLGDNPPDAWRTGFLVRARATENRLQLTNAHAPQTSRSGPCATNTSIIRVAKTSFTTWTEIPTR